MSDDEGHLPDDELMPITYSVIKNEEQTTPFNYIDPALTSPLVSEYNKGKDHLIQQLREKRLNPNNVDNNGNTILHHFSALGNKELIEIVKNHSQFPLNFNARNWLGETCLFKALDNQNINPSTINESLTSPDDDTIFIKYLLSCGCDVNISNNEEVTPLHLAVQKSTSDLAQVLIENGADIDALDFNEYTPLHESINAKSLENFYLLLFYGADVQVESDISPLLLALGKYFDLFDIEQLVLFGADVSFVDFGHPRLAPRTPLDYACLHGNKKMFDLFWNEVNKKQFLMTVSEEFFNDVILRNTFNNNDWMDVVTEIFTNSLGVYLIDKFKILFHNLCRTLHSRRISKDAAVKLVYLFMGLSPQLDYWQCADYYETYGHDEFFEVLVKLNENIPPKEFCRNYPNWRGLRLSFLVTPYRFSSFDNYPDESFLEGSEFFKFFTRKLCKSNTFLSNFHVSCPKLMEVARDAVKQRIQLCSSRNFCRGIFDYILAVRKLNVPDEVRQVLLLKKRLY